MAGGAAEVKVNVSQTSNVSYCTCFLNNIHDCHFLIVQDHNLTPSILLTCYFVSQRITKLRFLALCYLYSLPNSRLLHLLLYFGQIEFSYVPIR